MADNKLDSQHPYLGTDSTLLDIVNKMRHELEFFFVPSGASENPLTVRFMAFLTQFQDQYTSDWTADTVYGRMDPIATFQGTVRTISLGWAVPAYSGEEAENNLRKMSKLISMCYPVYGGQGTSAQGAGQISGAPLIKLKFANLITGTESNAGAGANGLLGWIDGISFTPNLETGFYDPAPGLLYPKQIDLTCQFHALHQHRHGWTKSGTTAADGKQSEGADGIRRSSGADNFPYGAISNFSAGGDYKKDEPSRDVDEAAAAGAVGLGANGEFVDENGNTVDTSVDPNSVAGMSLAADQEAVQSGDK
jgi:hypothetical protein